jgi:hypothetical protein
MNPLDQISLLGILAIAIILQLLFIEVGFRYGQNKRGGGHKAQMAQVRAIMGASLGLLAFMLAFSFSMAQQHFEERSRAYMMEVSAIDSAFRGADLLDDDARDLAQDTLEQFARLRIATVEAGRASDTDRVVEMIRESERMHDLLWALAESSMEGGSGSEKTGMFAQAVLAMINAHDARLQAAFFNRISPVIWMTLLLMALLAMVVMGYQAGLTGTRSTLATWTLAVAFAAVIALITDLDRPGMRLFHLNQQLMVELEDRMERQTSGDPGSVRP